MFFFPVESKNCMKSASYEYRKMSARSGAQFVPIGMPTVCLKTLFKKKYLTHHLNDLGKIYIISKATFIDIHMQVVRL